MYSFKLVWRSSLTIASRLYVTFPSQKTYGDPLLSRAGCLLPRHSRPSTLDPPTRYTRRTRRCGGWEWTTGGRNAEPPTGLMYSAVGNTTHRTATLWDLLHTRVMFPMGDERGRGGAVGVRFDRCTSTQLVSSISRVPLHR